MGTSGQRNKSKKAHRMVSKHWDRDQMAAICQTTLSNKSKCLQIAVFFQRPLQFVPMCPIYKNTALVHIVWRQGTLWQQWFNLLRHSTWVKRISILTYYISYTMKVIPQRTKRGGVSCIRVKIYEPLINVLIYFKYWVLIGLTHFQQFDCSTTCWNHRRCEPEEVVTTSDRNHVLNDILLEQKLTYQIQHLLCLRSLFF